MSGLSFIPCGDSGKCVLDVSLLTALFSLSQIKLDGNYRFHAGRVLFYVSKRVILEEVSSPQLSPRAAIGSGLEKPCSLSQCSPYNTNNSAATMFPHRISSVHSSQCCVMIPHRICRIQLEFISKFNNFNRRKQTHYRSLHVK